MKPTNDERREVAEILRSGVGTTDYMSDDDFIDWVHGVVSRSRDGHILDRLADFIEPEERTCHAVRIAVPFDPRDFPDDLVEVYQFRCSECSVLLEDDWSFCPNCGAKVVQQ